MNGQQLIAVENNLARSALIPKLPVMLNLGNPDDLSAVGGVLQVQKNLME
jgi:hypothetical protein